MVEIGGEHVPTPSCCRYPEEGMKVRSDSERVVHSQKMVLELLKSDMPQKGDRPTPLNPNSMYGRKNIK